MPALLVGGLAAEGRLRLDDSVSRALGVVVVRHGADASGEGEPPLGPSSFDEQLWRRLRAAMRY